VLAAAYADEPFVHVLPAGAWPHTAATAGSNSCHLQATLDVDSGRIVVVSALDNLGKGAAGQAVQPFRAFDADRVSSWPWSAILLSRVPALSIEHKL